MKCPRCSAEIPTQSQFCLRCGAAIHASSGSLASSTPFAARPASPNRLPLILGIVGLALVSLGIGAFAVRGQLMQKAGQGGSGGVVQAPGAGISGGLVQAPGEGKSSGLVQQPADPAPSKVVQEPTAPRPVDVEDYLAFLKQIEASKQKLIRKQTGDALMMMTQAKALSATIEESDYNNSFKDINKSMNYNADEWNQLSAQLETRKPPESCRDLHDKYYEQLGKIQSVIIAVNDAMSKVGSDPTSALHDLTQMQGKVNAEVDEAIRKADDALADVCEKYHLRKDFDVRGDAGSSSLLR